MKKKWIILTITSLALLLSGIVWIRHSRLERRNSEARESLKEVYELETAYRAMFGHYTDNMYAIVYIRDTLVTEVGKGELPCLVAGRDRLDLHGGGCLRGGLRR